MWSTNVAIFLLLLALGNGHILQDQLATDILHITAPDDFGHYLIERLAHNDAKFLSKRCFGQLFELAKGLIGIQPWALQMFDAYPKVPSGLLKGHGGALGTFDQCLKINKNNTTVGTIRGKYCLGGFRLLNLTSFEGFRTDLLRVYQPRHINLKNFNVYLPWGACLPDACSAKEFRIVHLFILEFPEKNCQTEENQARKLDSGDIGALSFLGVVAVLLVLSTIYDVIIHYLRKGKGFTVLRSFSILSNVKKIVETKPATDELPFLHGLRAMSLLLLVFGIRFMLYALLPLTNWLDLFQWITNKNTSVVMEGIIAADTFFVISGMLVAYNYLRSTEDGRQFNIIFYYLNRIIRLTPALVAAILIHATLIRHMGSGPVWPTVRDEVLVSSCREHWWSALLYVQNYVNPGLTSVCLFQTWQLSVDMQLFILSPLILIPLRRFPKYTLAVVGGLLVCSIVSAFLTAWVYNLKAAIASNRSLKDVENYIAHYFFPLHTHAAPWLIGFITGYLVYQIKTNKPKISMQKGFLRFMAGSFWAIAGGLMALCIFVGRELIGVEYNWLSHALHLAFVRPAWSIAMSWVIIACASGYGGPVNWLLSAPVFQVISRISYSTYLVYVTVMILVTFQTRVGIQFGEFEAVYRYWGDVAFSLALGFAWTLAFESPMIAIGKVLFGGSKRRKMKHTEPVATDRTDS